MQLKVVVSQVLVQQSVSTRHAWPEGLQTSQKDRPQQTSAPLPQQSDAVLHGSSCAAHAGTSETEESKPPASSPPNGFPTS